MDNNATSLQRQRIPNNKRRECLKLFEQGYGYKKTAQLAGLNTYTVREYKRRFVFRLFLRLSVGSSARMGLRRWFWSYIFI